MRAVGSTERGSNCPRITQQVSRRIEIQCQGRLVSNKDKKNFFLTIGMIECQNQLF